MLIIKLEFQRFEVCHSLQIFPNIESDPPRGGCLCSTRDTENSFNRYIIYTPTHNKSPS